MNNVETAQINKEGDLMPIGYKVLVESNSSYPCFRYLNKSSMNVLVDIKTLKVIDDKILYQDYDILKTWLKAKHVLDKRLTNLEIIKLMWNMYHVNEGYDLI